MGVPRAVFAENGPIPRAFRAFILQIAGRTNFHLLFFGVFLRGERTKATREVVRTSRAQIRDLPLPSARHGCRPSRA